MRSHLRRELLRFVAIVLGLGAGFYLVGAAIGSLSPVTRSNIPGAALGVVCPTLAALILTRRHGRADLASRPAR